MSVPLAEETKESLQLGSLELLTWSNSQLPIKVVDNRYWLELERRLEKKTNLINYRTEVKDWEVFFTHLLKTRRKSQALNSAFKKVQGFKSCPHT